MSVELHEPAEGSAVEIRLSGKLTRQDYDLFVPELERLIAEHGKIRLLVELEGFHGWTGGALWEDVKFDARHFNDIERLAMVGEERWHEWMTHFCKPFTTAEVRYFDRGRSDEARAWIASGQSRAGGHAAATASRR